MPPPDLTADLAPDPPTHSVTADPPTADPPPDLTGDLSSAPAAPGGPPVVPGYDVRDELGRGGMGVVYRAVHLKLNRAVALKVARADDRADPRHLLRFLAEAEAAAAVKHPHVVGVYDSGAAGGRPYLAMELCPGGTLADRLKASGRLDPRDAAALVGKLAGAVQACHDAGIVHRDLKPANVLFDAAGEPKVTDFGLVKRGLGSDLTATQAVMGTPAYMTPEQATGGAKFVGPAADIYALGTVLYECLTGARPFDGPDTLVLLKRIAEDPPEPPRKRVPSIPRDIELVCLRCLEKAPADRYPTAAALADDLRRFAAGEPVSVRPAGVVERTYKWARRKPTVAALYAAALAGAVLVAVATAIGLLWRDAEAARRTAEAERGRAEAAQGEAERARDQIAGEQGKTAAALSDAESARDLLRQEREKLALSEYARTMEVAHQEALGNNVAGAMALLEGTRPDLRGWEWHYVHKLCNGQQGTLPGRYGGRWSPDGSRLLTYGRNGIAQVYDTRTWAVSTTLTGHAKEGVSWGALSPDGSKVASFGERTVRVWDLSTGAELLALKGHNEAAYAVWSGDGGRLASIGGDDTVRVWDARTGTEVRAIRVLKPKEDNRVTLSPDGSNLATNTHRDPTVRVWDTRSGTLQATLQGHTDSVVEAVWSPDGRRFTTASHDTTVRVWDAKTWAEVAVLRGHTGFVWSAVWSPDGARLATASEDGTARVWEARSGGGLFVLSGHTRALSEIAWSPDGLRLLTASWDGTARVWDAKTGTEVVALRGHASGVGSASWSPDGRRVATSSDDGTVRVWDSGAEPRQVVLQGHQGVVQKAAWSPDRSRVATTSFDRTA
ncbi:MAG: protein kinase, partial [Gemmataceae bacterium]|nr:protein kinase [Gemmataceae bacterium]